MAGHCVNCDSSETPPRPEIKYAKGEPSQRAKRIHYLLPEPQSGYALYHCDDQYQTGFYLVSPKETNNLVTNPTFFTNLDGWSEFNINMIRTNELAFDSGFSVRVNGSGDVITAERRAYIEMEITEFLPGQTYTFSMYGWTPIIWDLSDPYMGTISIVDDLGNEIFSERLDKAAKWQRLSVTTVVDATATQLFLRLNLRSQNQRENSPPYDETGDFNLTDEYIYFDMGQLELGAEPTTPFHGDTNTCATCDHQCGGYTWNGVEHNSSSHRSACVRDGGKLVCLSDLGFEVTSHTGHGAPPLRDISFQLNNKPGEYHQKTVADARILTLTGQLCETTLKDLECAIHELGSHILPELSPCNCCDKFLLVYKHGECDKNECDTERDFALCVTYIGGLEGNRTNHYLQRASLQFKAHDPFWFEWPGHSSQALDFVDVVQSPFVVSIDANGSVRGFPVGTDNTYRAIACRPGYNSFAIGGTFDSINGDEDRCERNVAVWNCDEWLDLCLGFIGDGIYDMASDAQGNTLIAGSFTGPCYNVAIIYENGDIGCFGGYAGGFAYAIEATFFLQAAIGSENGVHLYDYDGNWTWLETDGPVYDISTDNAGNVYAVGDFTTMAGIETGNIAFININSTGCPDLDTIVIEPLGFTMNGNVTTVTTDKKSGVTYFGGEFTEATPLPVDICQVVNGTNIDSNGSDQILTFVDFGDPFYTLRIDYLNIITRNYLEDCINNGNYFRITAQSTFGTNYSFLLGPHNANVNSTGTDVGTIGGNDSYWITINIDTSLVLPEPCASLNESLVSELDQTEIDIATYSNLTLPGGTGIDNTINKVTAQCVTVTDQFQGDTVELNHVGQLQGESVIPMGDGVDANVNVVAVDPITGEVYAGTEQGLFVWNGLDFFDFAGVLGGSENVGVLDIEFCDNGCEKLILFDSPGNSALPGLTSVWYDGNVNPQDLSLVVHGPGQIQSIVNNGTRNGMRLCTYLECNEIATLNFNSGEFSSNYRSNLNPSVLGGSRYDMCLRSCELNYISTYIDNDDAQTKATLVWRSSFMGIESLCCRGINSNLETIDSPASQATTCDQGLIVSHRDPTDDDCRETGISEGTVWYNALSGCGLFISAGECEDCSEWEFSYVTEGGASLTSPDGEIYCGTEDFDECPDVNGGV